MSLSTLANPTAPIERTGATRLPIAIIGAGPIGLAAAAHVLARGETPLVLEAGETVGAHVAQWAHVRLFSPWKYNVDTACRALLEAHGWTMPELDDYPTGRDLVARYLMPLAATPELAPHLWLGSRVVSVTRRGFDKMKTAGRDEAPFLLNVRRTSGHEETVLARAVIDASGTWATPNPLGASGIPAAGEHELREHIAYGIPDVLDVDRERYAGRRILVAGSGHSAFNSIVDLAVLAAQVPGTQVIWIVRRPADGQLFGGSDNDALPARGALGQQVRDLVASSALQLVSGFKTYALQQTTDGIALTGEQDGADVTLPPVDELIVATGVRSDLTSLSELRLALDPATESPAALAPLIDPNVHSCGTVPPHGAVELAQPERDFYLAGMKSYGRAPTFLMLTGYEQVRSIAAALSGDWDAARDVELVLPETGVCSTSYSIDSESAACCTPSVTLAAPAELAEVAPRSRRRRSGKPVGIPVVAASAPATGATRVDRGSTCCGSDQ